MDKKVRIHRRTIRNCFFISCIVAILITILSSLTVNFFKSAVLVFADKDEEMKIEDVIVTEERTKVIEKEEIVNVTKSPLKMREIGSFRLTSYCPCTECCDQYGASPVGKTGSIGVGVYEGITFAVDPRVIPYGTKMYIEDVGVGIATDCGGAIKGNRIDVYIPDHQRAREFGTMGGQAKKVYIIE